MKKQSFLFLMLAAATALWMGCKSTSEMGNTVVKSQRFEKFMHQSGTVVLDVRTPKEYSEGHLPNAMLLDYNGGAFDSAYLQLDKSKTYLVYCRSGKRSDKAATKMKEAGFNHVIQLKDGIQGWKGATEKN